jgi:hypothetical protein
VADSDRLPEEPDVEIGASVRARSLRFRKKPQVDVKTRGHVEVNPEIADELNLEGKGGSRAERENLPDEVEPGVTYRDVRVGWEAGAALDHDEDADEPGSDESQSAN